MTRQALAAAAAALLAVSLLPARGTALVSDLSITNSDGVPTYTPGALMTYTIVVGNAGPDAVVGATVSDPVTSLAQVSGATWTCSAAGGGTCSAGTITGSIVDTIDLPVGATATYTLSVRLTTAATGSMTNTATVTPPAGTTDPVPDPSPNTASDTDLAAHLFYAATTGVDSPTCGAATNPCKTIQAAIDKTGSGDTVIVADGTYTECFVAVPGSGVGGVTVMSNQFLSTGLVSSAIVDGATVCDTASGTPGPVAKVFDLSAVVGMLIKDGGDSCVVGLGAVRIMDNVISNCTSPTTGGGIRLTTGINLSDAQAQAQIESNTVTTNTSAGDGGGIFVDATAQGIPSRVAISFNNASTNTAGGVLAASGAGIAVHTDTAGAGDLSSVILRSNTVTGNTASGPAAGPTSSFGGGIYVETGAVAGLGTETVSVGVSGFGNTVRTNVAAGFGGGISVRAQPAPGARHSVDVTANTVSANTGNRGGGGVHLYARAADRAVGAPTVVVTTSENAITGNHALGDLADLAIAGGGGIYAELYSSRTAAAGARLEISGNTIESNVATTHGGGASLLASADDDPQSDGAVAATGALVTFHNNLVAKNAARDATADGPSGGGVHGLVIARGALAQAGVSLTFLTLADNETELGTGGIEWQDRLVPDSLGSPGTGSFLLADSIVSGNDGYGVGYSALLAPATTVAYAYNDTYGNVSGNYEAALGDPTGTNGNVSVDPELDALFLPLLCGPTIDAGDPSIPAANEPLPNGGRVNMGHLGNTTAATRTFPDVNGDGTVDGLDVMAIAVSFNSCTGASCADPSRYFLAGDRDLNGVIDGADLAYVSAFYAQSCP
jgi:uncharacterized repeat protein (TIGR01451 family)